MASKKRNPITGLIHVTGEHDTGKTVFALSCGAQPDRIAYFDDDVKGRATVEQLKRDGFKFGEYIDLAKEFDKLKEVEINTRGVELVNEKIVIGKFDCVVWDTWTRFGASFFYAVRKQPEKYKDFYAPNSRIKMGEMSKAAMMLEMKIISDILDRVPLLILTTHLRDDYINDKKTGRQVPDAKRTLEEKSNFRVWLRHNPDGPEPIGLVLKRPIKLEVTEKGIVPINILPRKMNPCNWERIVKFWNAPVGNRPLTESEKPNEFEMSILDGVLTQDQKNILRLAILESEQESKNQLLESDDNVSANDLIEQAKTMLAEGKSAKQIIAELGLKMNDLARAGLI